MSKIVEQAIEDDSFKLPAAVLTTGGLSQQQERELAENIYRQLFDLKTRDFTPHCQ